MLPEERKLVLAGGSGFLGGRLACWFSRLGWDVVVLSRRLGKPATPARTVVWDGRTVDSWRRELEGTMGVINLSGRTVDCRYNARNRRDILASRIDSTRVIGQAIAACRRPPKAWLNLSTATIYKHAFDRAMDEATGVIASTPEAKDAFSIEVAQAWEQALAEAPVPATRKLALRTAMVLGTQQGTVYRVLRRLARLGLGGAMAGGRQYVSWIHETDFCRAVEWLLAHEDFDGVVNLAAPHPLPNRELMRLVRQACGARLGLPAAQWMLEVGAVLLRTETELIIKSRRVVPGRLLAAGFDFQFPEVRGALAELEARIVGGAPEDRTRDTRFTQAFGPTTC